MPTATRQSTTTPSRLSGHVVRAFLFAAAWWVVLEATAGSAWWSLSGGAEELPDVSNAVAVIDGPDAPAEPVPETDPVDADPAALVREWDLVPVFTPTPIVADEEETPATDGMRNPDTPTEPPDPYAPAQVLMRLQSLQDLRMVRASLVREEAGLSAQAAAIGELQARTTGEQLVLRAEEPDPITGQRGERLEQLESERDELATKFVPESPYRTRVMKQIAALRDRLGDRPQVLESLKVFAPDPMSLHLRQRAVEVELRLIAVREELRTVGNQIADLASELEPSVGSPLPINP